MRERIDEGSGERRSSRVASADNSQFGPEFAILKAVKRTCISIITAQSLKRTCIPGVRTKQFRSATPGRVP